MVKLPQRYDPQLEAIGSGGFGTVYRSRDLELGIDVAVKVPFRGADRDLGAEVTAELAAVARLRHPNIVQMLDAGTDEDGASYLVMEYAGGGSIGDFVKGEPPAWDDLVPVLSGILEGIGFAHAEGLVHRDIKAENILLGVGPDGRAMAKLADFGLAKVLQRRGDYHSTRLQAGTLLYMAPEQFEADVASIHPGADLYAFGVLLYLIVAGRGPWDASDMAALMWAKLSRPHRRFTPRAGYPVPPGLDHFIDRLLDRKPAYRYGMAAAVRRDLLALGPAPSSTGRRGAWLADETWAAPTLPEEPPEPPAMSVFPPTTALTGVRFPLMVDRIDERQRLWDAARDASEQSVGLILHGKRGSGRSRLVQWLGSELERGGDARTFHLRFEQGTTATEALGRAVRRFLHLGRLGGDDLTSRLSDWIESRGDLPSADREILSAWLDPAAAAQGHEVDPKALLDLRLGVIERLLAAESRTHTLGLVWIEDSVEGASGGGLAQELLGRCSVADLPMLILYEPPGSPDACVSLPQFETLRLGPLPGEDVEALLRDLLPRELFAAALVTRARGNPLLGIEIARLKAAQMEALAHPTDTGRLPALAFEPVLDALDDTMTIPDIALARFEAFLGVGRDHPDRERLLVLMALLPRPIPKRLLRAAFISTADAEEDEAKAQLQQLSDEARVKGLLIADEDETWRFASPALKEATAKLINRCVELAELQVICAELLQQRDWGHGRSLAFEAGRLLLDAGETERALPLLTDAAEALLHHDTERARKVARIAGDAAKRLGLAPSDPRMHKACVVGAQAARGAGELDESEALLAQLADAALTDEQQAKYEAVRASVLMTRGVLDKAVAAAQLAAAAYERSGNQAGLASSVRIEAEGLYRSGQLQSAVDAFERAIALAHRAGSADDEMVCHLMLARALRSRGQLQEAQDGFEHAQTMAQQLGAFRYEGVVLRELGNLSLLAGKQEQAEGFYQASIQRLERGGYRVESSVTRVSLGELARSRGQHALARKEYAAALAVSRAFGVQGESLVALLNLAITELTMDRATSAARRMKAVDELLPSSRSHRLRPYIEAVRTATLAGTEQWEEAEAALEYLQENPKKVPADGDILALLEKTGDFARQADELLLSGDAFDLALRVAEKMKDEGAAQRIRGKLAGVG